MEFQSLKLSPNCCKPQIIPIFVQKIRENGCAIDEFFFVFLTKLVGKLRFTLYNNMVGILKIVILCGG